MGIKLIYDTDQGVKYNSILATVGKHKLKLWVAIAD